MQALITPERIARIRKPFGKGEYSEGYIFGRSNNRQVLARKINEWRAVEREAKWPQEPWAVWNTKLENYAGGFCNGKMDFVQYLEAKIAQAGAGGKTLRVLDVGIGTGDQWVGFLKTHSIELHGTALTKNLVHPKLRENVKLCSAAGIHRAFEHCYFDLVVTHYGAHMQEREALENALWVLKKGGEGIFSYQGQTDAKMRIFAMLKMGYGLVGETEKNGKYSLLHVRKL